MELDDKIKGGAFLTSLKRTNKEIKNDRAASIGVDAELYYRRAVEDLELEIRRLEMTREGMLDLSPTNALTLMVANDFNAEKFFEEDQKIGIRLRDLNIRLELARARYDYLFMSHTTQQGLDVVPAGSGENKTKEA